MALTIQDTLPTLIQRIETAEDPGSVTNVMVAMALSGLLNKINDGKTALDALVSGDTSSAIDNYNEIIKFLEGFRDDETLAGTLKNLSDMAGERTEEIHAQLVEHKGRYNELVRRVDGIVSRANRIMDFDGIVARIEDVPTNNGDAVYWVNSVGGFRSGRAPDDPTLRELGDYNNEAGEGRYDRLFRCDNELYMVSDDKLVGYCNDDDLEYLRMALEQRLDTTDKAVDTISKNLASKPWRGDLNVLPFDGTVDSEFTLTQNGAEWEGKTVYVSLAHGFATVAPYWNVSSGTAQPAGYRVGYLPEYTEGSTVLDRRPRADRVYVCDGQVYVPSGNTIAPVCTAASLSSAVSQLRASIEKNRQTISSVQTEMYGLLDECPWRGDLAVYPLAGTVFNAQASTDSMEAWRLYYDANDHRVAMLDDETSEVTYPQGPNNVMHGIAAGNQEALFILNGELCHITNGGLVFLVDGDEIEAMKEDATALAGRVTDLETGHVPSNQYYALCESLFGRDFTLVANEKVRGLWAYDRNTRRYSFDRLTNITRPQMDAALLAAPLMFRAAHQAGDFALPGLRFCVIPYGTTLAAGMFADSEVEEAVFPGTFNNYPSISGTPNLFDGAAKLRYVVGYLNVRWAAEGSMQTFRGCSALEEIRIFKLTQNISFSDSPNLSMESLQYLVDNASNASSIFVGLHADCYARLTEEVRAAANEKGISFGIV